jgi:hypothetical protein
MANYYGQIKKMKTAKIGTIMPWAGDGNFGTLPSNVPIGWILCDGKVYQANRYPLLTSVLGNSYGGTVIDGSFPHYTGTIKIPNLTGKVMMDLEASMLFDNRYNAGQTDAYQKLSDAAGQPLVVDDGLTKTIPTLISADTNLVFTLESDLVFNGKLTGANNTPNISVTDPSFTATVYTIGRKLGINHTGSHTHPGSYSTAVGGAAGPLLFSPDTFEVGGSGGAALNCPAVSWYQATLTNPDNATQWCAGSGLITYFDDTTLIETSQFNEFISTASYDYSQIPPSTAQPAVYEAISPFTNVFTAKPMTTHAMKAWEGYFPRPMEIFSNRNFFGYNTTFTGPTGIADDPEYLPATTIDIIISAGSSSFVIPAGTNIGQNLDKIRPFMLVTTVQVSGGPFFAPGTQIIAIERTAGTSPSDFEYTVELSNTISGAGTALKAVKFRNGTYPTTLNNPPSGQDPAGNTFISHNHGTFEVTMGEGLRGPTTHPVNDFNKGDVVPESINGALNILANVANPSQNIVYIIRAY